MRSNRRISTVKKERFALAKQYWWLAVMLLAITCYELCIHFAEPRLLPIKHIKFQAQCELINEHLVKQHTARYVKGFFSTDVMRLKKKLLEIPYVEEATVKRIWPDTLLVTLEEQKFVAAWGEAGAVTTKGVIAKAEEIDQKLPRFIGPDGQAATMLAAYNEMSKIIQPLDLSIKELNLNERRSWQVRLNNNVKIIVGRKDIEQRLASLTAVYPKLKKRHGDEIDLIDLRYPNGICVHTK